MDRNMLLPDLTRGRDSISRGGGHIGLVQMHDPVELLARGDLP
jgi:hypothetical protein